MRFITFAYYAIIPLQYLPVSILKCNVQERDKNYRTSIFLNCCKFFISLTVLNILN